MHHLLSVNDAFCIKAIYKFVNISIIGDFPNTWVSEYDSQYACCGKNKNTCTADREDGQHRLQAYDYSWTLKQILHQQS